MQRQKVIVKNRLGLHARAAARLVRLASSFQSEIELLRCDARHRVADAKSILGVLMLAATQDTELEVVARGVDEQAALSAVVALINDQFGES